MPHCPAVIFVGRATGQAGVTLAKGIGILSVIVAVIDIGSRDAMRITGGIEHRARAVHRLGGQVEAARHIVQRVMRSVIDCQVSFSGHQPTMLGCE